MKPKKYFCIFLLSILSILGQSQVDVKKEISPVTKNKEIKTFPIEKGLYDHTFKLTNNETWNVKISIPEIKEDEEVPLIIALHWAGDPNVYQEYASCLALPALDTLKGIIIIPSSNGLLWTDPKNENKTIDLIRKIKKYWPVAQDKTIITGYSSGAIATWNYIKKYPKLFSAGIPMAGIYDESKIKIPLFVIHGNKDELFNYKEIEHSVHQSIKKGSHIDFQIADNRSHFMACSFVDFLKEKVLKVKNEIFEN